MDVWSYGVTLTQLFTQKCFPFDDEHRQVFEVNCEEKKFEFMKGVGEGKITPRKLSQEDFHNDQNLLYVYSLPVFFYQECKNVGSMLASSSDRYLKCFHVFVPLFLLFFSGGQSLCSLGHSR